MVISFIQLYIQPGTSATLEKIMSKGDISSQQDPMIEPQEHQIQKKNMFS